MNHHTGPDRLASDVTHPKKRNKAPQLRHSPQDKHREQEAATLYESWTGAWISWEDAVGYESDGKFVLPPPLRTKLYRHFCENTVNTLREFMQKRSNMAQDTGEDYTILADTLMMIQYFKTHLLFEGDYWNPVIGDAGRTVLVALGYDQSDEESLEKLYEMLRSAILHAHFLEALKHAAVEQDYMERFMVPLYLKTCSMCDAPIETERGRDVDCTKAFVCPADDCYGSQTPCGERFTLWIKFWDHQVQAGHLLCPKMEEEEEHEAAAHTTRDMPT